MNNGRIQQIGSPTDIYNEPVNSFVADFIGESNILDATMLHDRKVSFIGHEFECVDEGFGENVPVDVVVRPEDIYIMKLSENAQFTGVVKSCIFKGVHYEMFVETDSGNEIMIQDYNAFEVGTKVGMIIKPGDIQVMHKERTCNTFTGRMTSDSTVEFCGGEFECAATGFKEGDEVTVEIPFGLVDLTDSKDDGVLSGEVSFILYKGDHYHLTVTTDQGYNFYVDTNDIWDKADIVGINALPGSLKISKPSGK